MTCDAQSNVLMTASGIPMLADFGLARALIYSNIDLKTSSYGRLKGTWGEVLQPSTHKYLYRTRTPAFCVSCLFHHLQLHIACRAPTYY